VPVCINYQSIVEDSMIGKKEYNWTKIKKKIENMSLL